MSELLESESEKLNPNPTRTQSLNIPEYSGQPYVVVNNNEPFFEKEEMKTKAFEKYSDLDKLGRCGVAYANLSRELMPTESRGNISNVNTFE